MSSATTTSVLVLGATGRQGGAVVDALRSGEFGGFDVTAGTRNPASDAAASLRERGVSVVPVDMLDEAALVAAMDGVDAVFAVTTFFEGGVDTERAQGEHVVAASAIAGVDHLVFSSVGSADADTGLEHFESKAHTERLIAASDVDATVLRPVYFMQNLAGQADEILSGTVSLALGEGTELAMVDARDIGRAAAAAFADPERFVGETLTLAGDSLTVDDVAAVLSDYLGSTVEAVHLDPEALRATAGDELADMFVWFEETGYDVDVAALAATLGFRPRDLETCLAETEFVPRPETPAR
ncbi:NmrA/HSCARG family protein [Halobaculum lipolyticum]|uniref:NmrA/HSCARG family protein n=1 Tax=Halobaculum lipolyticum TaxID=3032001 RepID=A0ABD5WD36_9EURY|nr:NmrA/HSCARG family protein [Halobaculum sp. DT31]